MERFKWFAMVGAIANDAGRGAGMAVANDGSPAPHQYVALTDYENMSLEVILSGYLYCFPNDAWCFYENNHGSVQLTVHCVS